MRIVSSFTCIALATLLWPGSWPDGRLEAAQHSGHSDDWHSPDARSGLVETVRRATERFRDVRNAGPDYGPILGCVSGPDQGAMGVHFVNGSLLDGALDPAQPEALIYEFTNRWARLVGVEFIVPAEAWHATHAPNDPPVLSGQLLQFVDSPNRFGLPAFYELHVWAWRDNPNGAFADWNPKVSCEGQ
jgi:hypothetical protein